MTWAAAAGWGFLSGASLLMGAAFGWRFDIPKRVNGLVMAFGVGVLLSTVSFELIGKASTETAFVPRLLGALAGAFAFTGANALVARHGARHRKRSNGPAEVEGSEPLRQPSEGEKSGSGIAIAIGALLDGVPESAVLGLGMVQGGQVSLAVLVAIFLSNLPEGMSSSIGMRQAGRSKIFVFGIWFVIALFSGLSSAFGFLGAKHMSPQIVAFTMAFAGGAILAMIADTMAPEAFEKAHLLTGVLTVAGFLTGFALSRYG